MEAVPGLEQQVALVSKLVRQASSHDAAGDDRARLDLGHDDRNVGIREPRLMARPGLDDVAADLRLSERGLELRREAPRTGPHLLGEAETYEHLQTSQFLTPELPHRRRPREPPEPRPRVPRRRGRTLAAEHREGLLLPEWS